jgi:broad specificity phosphatase PhoE
MYKKLIIFLTIFFWSPSLLLADSITEQIESIGANVIFMRHAIAPGTGDPKEFKIEDCETQRNLSDEGRKQAIQLGNFLKSNIKIDRVFTSQWCRCIETAQLLDLADSETFPGLNSFYQDHFDRASVLKNLNNFLQRLDKSTLTLLVTHQVVISAITGQYADSGGIVLYNSESRESHSLRQ